MKCVISRATAEDECLQKVIQAITGGWSVQATPYPYGQYRDEPSVPGGILFKSSRIVIPSGLQKNMLIKIHKGHLGMDKSQRRANAVSFWPKVNTDIEQTIRACETCQKCRAKRQCGLKKNRY